MACKSACQSLQMTVLQNQEVLDLSPKFAISFFAEHFLGSGISAGFMTVTSIPSKVLGKVSESGQVS
jgi:hypothetical protein